LARRLLEVVAQAPEHLDLDVAVVAAHGPAGGERVRDRAQVVARDGDADRRPRREQAAA
jgi:hypothetical protein